MTEFFENYLQDSVGFIYVINDAINVHKVGSEFLGRRDWDVHARPILMRLPVWIYQIGLKLPRLNPPAQLSSVADPRVGTKGTCLSVLKGLEASKYSSLSSGASIIPVSAAIVPYQN